MVNLLAISVICACVAAFIVTLLRKWGVTEYLEVNGDEMMQKLVRCNFCLSFWITAFLACVTISLTGDIVYLLIPIIATPLARILL